ncbi:MAG: hypothetical protein JWQ04_1022 [Pedosphaera sp.]|nr:hypothetical protein [Pedosphaera sp.]
MMTPMTSTAPAWRTAWEPLTPRGVAAFAGASLGRLLLVQLLVALLAAAAIGWFLERAWFPVIRAAIHELPAEGGITNGELGWSGESPLQLAENRFLGLAVDLFHSGELGREAHLQVEFGRDKLRVYSLLGYEMIKYPPGWNSAFNRTGLEPWWGAWEPWIRVSALGLVVAGLMASWTLLATLYCAPVRILSFLANRDLQWRQSWRLAGAANLPGALFLTAGIVAYSLGWMDLIRLGGMFGLHFVVGWIYIFISPWFCPPHPEVKKLSGNPFAAPKGTAPPAPPPP